jgi:protein gp37
MGLTSIEWTATPRSDGTLAPGYTFNPWRGCTKVSPGCTHCYAEATGKRNPRVLGEWGLRGRRAVAAESYWRRPLAWDRAAARAGERRRVFCASLADVFEERDELEGPRERLRALMSSTPHLDWLLLTKRPDFAARWIAGRRMPDNYWLGVSVEDQERADEGVPILLRIRAPVRFLSVEPLLGPVDLRPWLWHLAIPKHRGSWPPERVRDFWVIVGGESGPRARPCDPAWIRSIAEQCRSYGVPCFVKQLGRRPVGLRLVDKKGGDPAEWPEDVRVREFPRPDRVASPRG